MTREDVINELRKLEYYGRPFDNSKEQGEKTIRKAQALAMAIQILEQEPKTGHCKECKYFERDSVVKADGAPLIVAHEICSKWGRGCKTRETGYCFLFEPQERSKK